MYRENYVNEKIAKHIKIYLRDTTRCVVNIGFRNKMKRSHSDRLRCVPRRNLLAGYNTACCEIDI
jgi:hypothetical protein